MKIAFVGSIYEEYLEYFYNKYPDLLQASSAEQEAAIFNDHAWTGDALARGVRKLGYEAIKIYGNNFNAQIAWAEEYGVSFDRQNWKDDITLARLKAFKADVVYVDDPRYFPPEQIRRWRENVPSLRFILGFRCMLPAEKPELMREFDILFTCVHSLHDHYKAQGLNAVMCRHAFDTRVIEILPKEKRSSEILFAGSLGGMRYRTRMRILREAGKHYPLTAYSSAQIKNTAFYFKHLWPSLRRGELGDFLGIHFTPFAEDLAAKLKPPIYGMEMFSMLQRSCVALNIHGDGIKDCAGNLRVFEAAGVGARLLTERAKDLEELLVPDEEVLTYRSVRDCLDKIKWIKSHPEEADVIAAAGQKRILKEHTFDHRAQTIADVLVRLSRK